MERWQKSFCRRHAHSDHGRVSSLSFLQSHGEKENTMEILFMLVALLVLDVVAWRWGVDSRDGLTSPEWKQGTLRDFGRE